MKRVLLDFTTISFGALKVMARAAESESIPDLGSVGVGQTFRSCFFFLRGSIAIYLPAPGSGGRPPPDVLQGGERAGAGEG